MARLPSIDPFTRTLLVTGFPNVGKSSFFNQITEADVEVQPYPFTTQSLYVGHTDYNTVRWQVIDSPGILDKPLEQRNTIEMQSVTALAHLKACIMYFLDISGDCGYSIDQQVSLFRNIKPLFQNKPLLIVLTKSDLCKFEDLNAEDQAKINALSQEINVSLISMSTKTNEGVFDVKARVSSSFL
jgi:nucleolar GTP-binding protein